MGLPFLALLVLALAGGGCASGGGDGTGGAPPGTAVVQLTDAPFSQLTSFQLTIVDIVLVRQDGSVVGVFPPSSSPGASLTVDLAALAGARRTIAVASVPATGFTGARISFVNASAQAGGTSQVVTPSSGTMRFDFAERAQVHSREVVPFVFDFDGNSSVVSTGASSFNLEPKIFTIEGEDARRIDQVIGVAHDITLLGFRLAVDDADRQAGEPVVALGELPVLVGSGVLFNLDGALATGTTGLDALAEGDVVTVSGRLSPDGLVAEQVAADRQGATNPIRVRGSITSLSSPSLDLVVDDVLRDDQGQLGSLGPGDTLTATTSPTTTSFFRSVGEGPVTFADLFPGQLVDVEGASSGPGVNAATLALRESALDATLTAVAIGTSDATAAATVTASNGVPVASFPTLSSVTIDFTGITPLIDGIFPIEQAFLAPGRPVRAIGSFTTATDFQAARLFVLGATEIQGAPVSVDIPTSTFVLDVGGSPVRVLLRGESRLGITRTSQGGLFQNRARSAFLDEMPNATGAITVRGIANSTDFFASRAAYSTP